MTPDLQSWGDPAMPGAAASGVAGEAAGGASGEAAGGAAGEAGGALTGAAAGAAAGAARVADGETARGAAAGIAGRKRSLSGLLFKSMTSWRIGLLTQLFEMLLMVVLAVLFLPGPEHRGPTTTMQYLLGALIVAVVSHFSFFQARLYDINLLMEPLRAMKPLLVRWTVVFMMVAALTALAHAPNHYSRFWFAGFYSGGLLAIGVERWLLARFIREWIHRGHYSLSVAIVGGNLLAEKLIRKFDGNPWGIRFTGVFDDRMRDNARQIAGVPVLGTIGDLLEFSKTNDLDTIILTLPLSPSDRIHDIIRRLRQQPVSVRLLPGAIGLERVSPIRLDRTELPGVQLLAVADRPISDFALLAKGICDRAAALAGLLLLAPFLLACAGGIKLTSRGPVFFKQKRVGYKGRNFDILKFRTMHVTEQANLELTRRGDQRVFKFGGLLRRLSVDELPQLINVLKGDMSLVGPRPHMPEARAGGRYYFDVVDEYANRQRVKPGITGWAQVNGWRGPTETVEQIERRVECDIYYIENWSLLLDLIIIIKTVLVGFHGKNAF